MKLHATSLLAALVVVLASGQAHAGRGIVLIGGNAEAPRRHVVSGAVNDAARKAGWQVVDSPLSKQATQRLLSCPDPSLYACVPNTLVPDGIDHLFVIKVDSGTTEAGAPLVTIDATLIGTEPRMLVSNKKHCDHCADDELRAESSSLATGMINDLAQRSGRTVLDVKTTPSGARILLDGKEIGYSDARFSIPPGPHQITLEKPGHLTKTIDTMIDEGSTKALEETLVTSGTRDVRPAAARSRLPAILLVGGVVLIGGGVAMVALDDDPSLTGGRKYFNGAPLGIAIGSAGIVSLGVGAYLWRTSKKTSTPTMSFVPGGAVVGWSKSL
ncbi:MAG: PEGA domain-containing protein [Kofleriaceae bacterium]